VTATSRGILVLAGVIVIVAGLKASAELITPVLLALFLSMIAAAPMSWMIRAGVPRGLATAAAISVLIVFLVGLGAIIGAALDEFGQLAGYYRSRLQLFAQNVLGQLADYNIPETMMTELFNPAVVLDYTTNMFGVLSGLLSNSFLILLLIVFMLLELSHFPAKLGVILSREATAYFKTFQDSLDKYLVIKTGVSLLTGLTVWIVLGIVGVNFALIWALLAFLLNYIPNIGSFIAAIPPVLLAFIDLGASFALGIILFYLLINSLYGNILEPKLLGRSLGLSTLVVFISLVFWGWVFGPMGMLLSVPLTMVVKIGCEIKPETRWLAVLLSDYKQLVFLDARSSGASLEGDRSD